MVIGILIACITFLLYRSEKCKYEWGCASRHREIYSNALLRITGGSEDPEGIAIAALMEVVNEDGIICTLKEEGDTDE